MTLDRHDLNSVIIDTVANLVVVLDREGRLRRFNRACEKLTGRVESDVLGQAIWDLFLVPDEIPGVKKAFAELAAGETLQRYENHWIGKNGRLHRLSWSSTCVLDAAGQVEYVIGTALDITEQKQAEEAKRLAESRFRRMAESNIIGVLFFHMDGRITDANDAFLNMIGYSREDLHAGKIKWSEITPPEHLPSAADAVLQIREFGAFAPFEKEYFRKDGSRVAVMISGAIFHETPDAGVTFVVDMSARKQAEALLRESEERFRIVVDSSPDMMFYQDRDLRITWYSNPVPPLTQEDVVGKMDVDFVDEAQAQILREVKLRVLSTGVPEPVETTVWFGDDIRHYESVIQRRQAADGTVLGIAGYVRDITLRKNAEDKLRKLANDLTKIVDERTAAISEQSIKLQRTTDQLRRTAAGARCILWYAEIEGRGKWRENPDFNYRIDVLDRQAAQNVMPLDLRPDQTYFNAWAHSRHPDDDKQMFITMSTALLNGDPGYKQEFRCTDKNGQLRWLREEVSIEPLAPGRWRAFGVCTDITQAKEVESRLVASQAQAEDLAERYRRLIQELDHRVRNNLAGLLSLIDAIKDQASSVDDFAHAINSRLLAMVHIHDLLAARGWRSVKLRELLSSLLGALERLSPNHVKLKIECEELEVIPSKILPLAMILVEWFTNSSKYGAHSQVGGNVGISCQGYERHGVKGIRLRWRERGGPPVTKPFTPSLGTELVEGFATRELGGNVTLRFPPEGAEHELEFAIDDANASV